MNKPSQLYVRAIQARGKPLKVLVIGATGLLGNALMRTFVEGEVEAFGTTRRAEAAHLFAPEVGRRLIVTGPLESLDALVRMFEEATPDVVINCAAVGRPAPLDPMQSIAIYSTLPQRLAHLCRQNGVRLIQISSDGVFSGRRGNYSETDIPDANDVYGVAKLLGEVSGMNALTLRLSLVGHELTAGGRGLLEWFLSQQGSCRCFTRGIFSGLSTLEIAKTIRDVVLPRADLHGIYHLAGVPISKYDLLRTLANVYCKDIPLIPDDTVQINRSLATERFFRATGYIAPPWPVMAAEMKNDTFGLPQGAAGI